MQNTRDYMLICVAADGPCSLAHVLADCKFQGFTKGFVQALQSLKNAGLVRTDCDDDGATIIELV